MQLQHQHPGLQGTTTLLVTVQHHKMLTSCVKSSFFELLSDIAATEKPAAALAAPQK